MEWNGMSDTNSNNNNNSDDHHKRCSKAGRKGDPRMHRAVAARLENPALSLFEALQIGGFDYPRDEDSSCMDSDHIKLGQRKNQLSRRVRLAKKHNNNHGSNNVNYSHHGEMNTDSSARQLPGRKRSLLDEEEQLSRLEEEENAKAEMEPMRMAKFHPGFHPILVHPTKRQATAAAAAAASNETLDNQRSFPHQTSTNGFYQPGQAIQGGNHSPTDQHNSSRTAAHLPLVAGESAGGIVFNSGRTPSLASGVAMASLNQTAAKAGMSLEQLALVLQSNATLSNVLSAVNSEESTPTHLYKNPKQLALAFHKNESRMLYEKVMLQAGYAISDAKEGTEAYNEFAWEACHQESLRLQQKILEQQVLDPPLQIAQGGNDKDDHSGQQLQRQQHLNTGNRTQSGQQQQQQLNGNFAAGNTDTANQTQQHSNGHVHDEHHAECDSETGHHVHRLEGKCGHKAILHQPPDGKAHIDFVVGDEVECYHGVNPLMLSDSGDGGAGRWHSRFKCQDLPCTNEDCLKAAKAASLAEPKILNLSELNIDGKEWNAEFGNDETLVGLFKLADATPSENGDTPEKSTAV